MKDYIITKFENHQVTLKFDGRSVNFVIPVVDGLYPEGAALEQLLDTYVANARSASSPDLTPVTNAAAIQALVTPPTSDQIANAVRLARGRLLAATDWTQMSDTPIDETLKVVWLEYRAQLRNITKQTGFPLAVLWPTPPAPVVGMAGTTLTNPDGSLIFGLRIA